MNHITRVKHFRAQHTTVRWLLADWSEFAEICSCLFKSDKFCLNGSGVTCTFQLVFTDAGCTVLFLEVGPRSQPISMYLSLAILDCDLKKEMLMCDERISMPADKGTTLLRFNGDEEINVSDYGKKDAISILGEFYELYDSEEDEGYVHEHCIEGGGEARVLDDVMSHDGIDNYDDEDEDDDGDDDKPYTDRLVMFDYDQLYRNQDLCDLTVVVAGEAFMCHTFVIATISSYMARLIRQTRACYFLQRHIDLSNETWLLPSLFQAFLEYAYGAQSLFELRHQVFELLLLALKFHVRKLKLDCEVYLRDNMDKFNVTRILCLAHQYGCKVLKREAVAFAKTCIDDLRVFGELDTLRNDPQLYFEVVGDDELNGNTV